MKLSNIRNFSIIAHIDHGKSTLADRLLEITHTVEKRKMKDQVLDSMDLERERGITIKMTPVRMEYHPQFLISNSQFSNNELKIKNSKIENSDSEYILNLIDTPGHIDFSYEVSRSLKAVEGAVLLVDAAQGIQAQTITTLTMAQELGLVIIPTVSKIDSPYARTEEVKKEIAEFLSCSVEDLVCVSGKTGEGVDNLFATIISRVQPPVTSVENVLQALVFDFEYSPHKGIVVYSRLFNGEVKKGDELIFAVTGERFQAAEVGVFVPGQKPVEVLKAGETGY